MLDYMKQGGSIMWIIGALSLIAAAIAVERIIFFHKASTDPEKLEAAFGKAVSAGDVKEAWRVAESSDSSMNRLFKVALTHWNICTEDMKLLTEQQIRREIYRWENTSTSWR